MQFNKKTVEAAVNAANDKMENGSYRVFSFGSSYHLDLVTAGFVNVLEHATAKQVVEYLAAN